MALRGATSRSLLIIDEFGKGGFMRLVSAFELSRPGWCNSWMQVPIRKMGQAY